MIRIAPELRDATLRAIDRKLDAALDTALATLRHDGRDPGFDLASIDPASRPLARGDKADDKARVETLAEALDRWQDLFFADKRRRLLVILQGTDTSGKDGTIRAVFGRMSALGVNVVGWRAPAGGERERDFLWRIHQQVPADGHVTVFNRSHYEDVLVPRVMGHIDAAEVQRRLVHIQHFEQMLVETGTVVVKFLLHISKAEQRDRLQARLDDPTKVWKFDPADLEARKRWTAYQRAYADAVRATGTACAPWIVVPADSKTQRNLLVASVMVRVFSGMGLRYPPPAPELAGLQVR